MVLTKKQKILGAVLSAAVAIFVGDRVLLGLSDVGPARAEASPAGEFPFDLLDTQGLLSEDEAPQEPPEKETTLSDRLEEVAQSHHADPNAVRDAFCPSASWSGVNLAEPASLSSAEAMAKAFVERHKLTATAVSAKGGMAIIDGQCLVIGRELDGFRLVSVSRNSAVLVCDGVKAALTLPGETPGN